MKRFIKPIVIIFVCLFVVMDCIYMLNLIFGDDVSYYTIAQEVDQIEIIKVLNIDLSEEKIVELGVISAENHQEFISELSQLPMSYHTPPFTGVAGFTYQIEYYDGECELICSCVTYYSATDSENGSFHFDDDQFEALWEKYGSKYEH